MGGGDIGKAKFMILKQTEGAKLLGTFLEAQINLRKV
jgi:hypothetical protein